MHPENNMPGARGQETYSVDFLDVLLREGLPVSRDLLLSLCPDEPLGPPEGIGTTVGERQPWPKAVHALREKYPGYQPDCDFRTNMMYGRIPRDDAPLSAYMAALIAEAQGKWCREIDAKRTRLQFRDWMLGYLDQDKRVQSYILRWDEATHLLRQAYGLPRLALRRRTRR